MVFKYDLPLVGMCIVSALASALWLCAFSFVFVILYNVVIAFVLL